MRGRREAGEDLTPEDLITVELGRARRSDPGYDEGAVDDLLDDVVAAMREGSLTPGQLARWRQRLEPVTRRLRPGYDRGQVDALLDRLHSQLAAPTPPAGAPTAPGPSGAGIGNDQEAVAQQYAREDRLETRRSVWRGTADGTDPVAVAIEALAAAAPRDLLEIGCGTGEFASRVAARLPGARLVATDQSPRMVELAAQRGLDARQVDASELPFGDDAFDAVAAMWMLYHVPDLDRTLAQVRRVLRPDGVLIAMTNGDGHLADLLTAAGGEPIRTQFSRENGATTLRRHFAHVEQIDFDTRAVFPDHGAAQAYLATFDPALAEQLPPFAGEAEFAGAATLFIAT